MAWKKKPSVLKADTTVKIAARIGAANTSRKKRDRLTRVTSPIKAVDTNGRQWNRYSP
jgi:hypothetical protein